MKKLLFMFAGAVLIAGYVFYDVNISSGSNKASIHKFTAMDIDGNDVSLKSFSGDILLIVNTASQCGYTPQYEGLQKIYDRFKDKNFKVIGFPTNNFGGQEPGSNEEIKDFCTTKYKVTFPMFAKISVKGEDQHPLYKFLTDKEQNGEFGGDITWNFNKFLANEKGEIVARFTSKDAPESETVINAIEKYIAERDAAKTKTK